LEHNFSVSLEVRNSREPGQELQVIAEESLLLSMSTWRSSLLELCLAASLELLNAMMWLQMP